MVTTQVNERLQRDKGISVEGGNTGWEAPKAVFAHSGDVAADGEKAHGAGECSE